MMKVTVNKYLNARIGKAATDAACEFYRPPGSTIEIDDVVTGTSIDGNAIWYHCTDDGCFYWSGGIEETEFVLDNGVLNGPGKSDVRDALFGDLKSHYQPYYKAKYPGLTGIGIGDKRTGTETIEGSFLVFQFLEKKNAAALTKELTIPKTIAFKGMAITTDVVQAPVARLAWGYSGAEHSPKRLGGTVSALEKQAAGTLSFIGMIETKPGKIYAVTNYHVVADHLLRTGKKEYKEADEQLLIVMPAWSVDADSKNEKGRLLKGAFSAFQDTALIELKDPDLIESRFYNDNSLQESIDIFRQSAYRGKAVRVYGAMSRIIDATISSEDINKDFTSEDGKIKNSMLELLQLSEPCQEGDSGGAVLLDGKLIGIIIGTDTNNSYVLPVGRIFFFTKLKPL